MGMSQIEIRGIEAHYGHPDGREQSRGIAFWDSAGWDRFLTKRSGEGYNAVVWNGPHETRGGRHGAEHLLLRLEEFPDARELPPKEKETTTGLKPVMTRR